MIDIDKLDEELKILRGFIDFINSQVGVYMDCLAGFRGNTVRIHRQIPRAQRPTGRTIKDGQPIMMYTSLEDPSQPDVIHHRIITAEDFLSANDELGFNHQQICWSIIVFIFTYWDEEIRPQIAKVRGVAPNKVSVDALGDLRSLRKCIIHNKGKMSEAEYTKLRVMADFVQSGHKITFSYDQMHKVFVLLKQAIAEIILSYTGHLLGAPDPSEIVGVAIQNVGARKD